MQHFNNFILIILQNYNFQRQIKKSWLSERHKTVLWITKIFNTWNAAKMHLKMQTLETFARKIIFANLISTNYFSYNYLFITCCIKTYHNSVAQENPCGFLFATNLSVIIFFSIRNIYQRIQSDLFVVYFDQRTQNENDDHANTCASMCSPVEIHNTYYTHISCYYCLGLTLCQQH